MDPISDKPMRFLSFADDKEDAEKEAKLKEAAKRIEEAISKEKSISELIDYVGPTNDEVVDPTNDTRPLYVRLQEQKNKKKEVEEESQKPSNFVSVLDEEEVDYLNEVERKRREEELKKRLEVYDALESKRRLDEQRALDEEKRRKESLLGSPSVSSKSNTKTRLSSMIKMKPKSRTQIVKDAVPTSHDDMSPAEELRKRPLDLDAEVGRTGVKRLGIQNTSEDRRVGEQQREENATKSCDTEFGEDKKSGEPNDCRCDKDLMKCIGILPSLPQATNKRDSSDESDQSDDDLERRLVPCIRRKH